LEEMDLRITEISNEFTNGKRYRRSKPELRAYKMMPEKEI